MRRSFPTSNVVFATQHGHTRRLPYKEIWQEMSSSFLGK